MGEEEYKEMIRVKATQQRQTYRDNKEIVL